MFLCIAILLVLFRTVVSEENPKQMKGNLFEIDKTELRKLWFTASMRGLLKAKAKLLFDGVPFIEQIVYKGCSEEAKSPGSLALCVVHLMDARDRRQKEQIERQKAVTQKSRQPLIRIHRVLKKVIIPIHGIKTSLRKYPIPLRALRYQEKLLQKQFSRRRNHRLFLLTGKKTEKNNPGLESENSLHSRKLIRPQAKTAQRTKRLHAILEEIRRKMIEHDLNSRKGKMLSNVQQRHSRSVDGIDKTRTINTTNIANLKRLQEHLERVDICNAYFKTVNDENQRLYRSLKFQSKTPEVKTNTGAYNQILEMINAFLTGSDEKKKEKFSILSPRLLSIMPEGKVKKRKEGILSPTMFSFHKDGIFSLQELFALLDGGEKSQQMFLELMLDLSGAGTVLEKMLKDTEKEIKEMEEEKYPIAKEMSRLDLAFIKAQRTFSGEQLGEYKSSGYTFYEKPQLDKFYGSGSQLIPAPTYNLTKFLLLNRQEKETLLEEEIREMADIHKEEERCKNGRCRRQAFPPGFQVMQPIAFSNIINRGSSMQLLALSPRAFIGELFVPTALFSDNLSPRAFIASILSPSAIVARTLSPTAFRAEVLSPRALTSWVLAPEAFLVKILSPKFLNPRVLSPQAFIIEVLSPSMIAPRVLSATEIGFIVLSPGILSPRVASGEKFFVEVLSPHILGGPHSKEEAEEGVISDDAGHEGHEEHGDDPGHKHLNEKIGLGFPTMGETHEEEHTHEHEFFS